MKINKKWFSIIEILIWIFIFTLWLVSIYYLIVSTMKLNDYSKNSIIASNLSREGIELVRHVRDTNYKTYYKWNKLPWDDVNSTFSTWVYYKIENDFSSSDYNVKFEVISNFWEWKSEINDKMNNYKLCLNDDKIYTYDCSTVNKQTYFYRYIKFDDVKYLDNSWKVVTLPNALKLTSKTIWYNRWYHDVELKTILTDFQRQ